MGQFDWHTEDDAFWDEPVSPRKRPSPGRPKRPWPVILLIVLALSAAGWVVYRQVQQQLESATTAVQTDILSTHNLVQTAVARQDLELFRLQLSGRDPLWTETEEALLQNNLVTGREFWGWRQSGAPETLPLTVADLNRGDAGIVLAPDLNAAELQFPQTYVLTTQTGLTETMTMTQTAVYRRGSQRWLLSPPDDEFWGSWVTNSGETLKLVYPERDAAVAERLAPDLETMVHDLCREWADLDCPADQHLTLRLSTDPDSLLTATEAFPADGQPLQLPTPTLLGLPQDEAGYQALYRAYGGQLATAVIARQVGWSCCRHAPIFQVLSDYMLSQMGIRPWPITAADHTRVLRDSVSMTDLNAFWDRRDWVAWQDQDGWELYAAVDFLMQTYTFLDPVPWLQELDHSRSLLNWVNSAFARQAYSLGPGPGILDALDEEWWQFAYSETLLAQERAPLPIPLPQQDLQIMCNPGIDLDVGSVTSFYHYDLQAETWTEVLSRTGYLLATPLRDSSGWVLQNLPYTDDEAWRTEIWRDGQGTSLFDDDYFSLTLGQFDPTGRYLISFSGTIDMETPQPTLLDLESCDSQQACDAVALSGQPFWSPDGRSTIVASLDVFSGSTILINGRMMLFDSTQPMLAVPLQLGDARGQISEGSVAFDDGYSPFWLDNQQFGYVRPGAGESGDEVLIADVAAVDPQVVLTMADITAVGPTGILAPATIRFVLTHPAQPSLLFIMALDALGREVYVFSYDLATEELALRLQSPIRPFHVLGFSPDGRWLVLTGSNNDDSNPAGSPGSLYVQEIATQETQTYVLQFASFILSPIFDWSADSQWLLFTVDDRLISLVAPDYAYQWVVAHGRENCTATYWTN